MLTLYVNFYVKNKIKGKLLPSKISPQALRL